MNMSADALTPAILNYISHGQLHPSSPSSGDDHDHDESESIVSATFNSPPALSSLLTSLQSAQHAAKSDLRALSRAAAPDLDTWIARATALQADIQRSRDAAHAIVAQADAARASRAAAQDQARKVELLESEVRFNVSLTATLEKVGRVEDVLASANVGIARGALASALAELEKANGEIDGFQHGRIKVLLGKRREGLLQGLKEVVSTAWGTALQVDVEGQRVRIAHEGTDAKTEGVGLEEVVRTARGMGLSPTLVEVLGKDIMKAIFQPRLSVGPDDVVSRIMLQDETLVCQGESDDSSYKLLFEDLRIAIDFLSTRLPPDVGVSLSETLIPALTTKVEEEWLTPAIPLSIADMHSFQEIFNDVLEFAQRLDELGWHGGQALREWQQNMPRTWITKKREQILGDVRNLVFTGLRETKTVERVETQMVGKDHGLPPGNEGGDDEWDTAWDEPEEAETNPDPPAPPVNEDEEDTSAWDVDESETKQEEGDEDAWGWGDGEENVPQPSSPKISKKPSIITNGQQPTVNLSEREMTLREQYLVTAVPDHLITLIQQVIKDAEELASSDFASLPIAPAATALYTLPTLALAIYRATAPTAYAKLGTSNMLQYNDASRLSDQLRAWQALQPPASRLRLDNDLKALDQFAKRAYGAEMESQRTILRDLLDGAQGFSNCTTAPFKGECESAVEQTVHRLRDVHKQWTGVLPPSALLQSVGSLLASVTSKMISDIEDLPDISEADSKELKILCDSASSVKDIFHQQAPDGNTNDMTFIYCPNWLKFQYLGEIVESSLADIKYLWNEGELSLEFEAEEVVGLIEALFAESQLRRQAISDIRRGVKH